MIIKSLWAVVTVAALLFIATDADAGECYLCKQRPATREALRGRNFKPQLYRVYTPRGPVFTYGPESFGPFPFPFPIIR